MSESSNCMKYSCKIRKCSNQEIRDLLILFDPVSFKPNSHLCDTNLESWLTKLSSHAQILTCYLNQVLVGTLFFYANDIALARKEGFCSYFCVLPEYRKQGIASYSLQETKSYLKKRGITHFRLKCAKSNIVAYEFYIKNGFVVVDVDNEFYTLVSLTSNDG